ncbi:MAG TPA: hypothetical protein VN155_17015 [Devosia sp.]|nr:hypothetical protein [Devosia sp.]
MGFLKDQPIAPESGVVGVGVHDRPDPSFLEVLGAAYRQDNLIGSVFTDARRTVGATDFYKVDEAFNPFDNLAPDLEQHAIDGRFDDVYNRQAFDAVVSNIRKEEQDRQTLAASGWTGFALSGLAGITDPTILLPGGSFVRAGQVGYSVGRTALAVGLAAAAGTAVQEAGLQATQETRSLGESALAIGGSAILGGLIGMAGAKFLSNAEWSRLGQNLERELSGEVENPSAIANTIVQRMQAAGADVLDEASLDDLGVGGPAAAQAVARATAALRINPGLETMFSPSRQVREVYNNLVDNPVYTSMNMEGRTLGAGVENLVKETQRGLMGQWLRESNAAYREARRAGWKGTRTQFNELIGQAGRRGDIDPSGNAAVTKMAQDARDRIFNPLLERAKKLGLLPEDVQVSTAASYVTRLWNRQRLIARENEFRQIASEYLSREIAKVPVDARPDFVSKADMDGYIEDAVTGIFNNLTGRGKGDTPEWMVPVTRGPLKERTFNIQDELVESFLESDMELVLRNYTRKMGAEIELTEKFGRADMRDQIEAINREYDDLSKAATTEAERLRLDSNRKRDIRNIEAFRDMVRGTYRAADEDSNWSRLTRAALTWNYIRLLGGVTISSLTDAARLIGVHGVRATMSQALPGLVLGLKAAKISRADARDLGVVAESVLQSRLASLADLQDPYRYGSTYERFLSNASNMFSKATGLSLWNDTMKTMASVMTQNRMMRNALNWGGIGKTERAYMAYLGIDENMARRIAGQFEAHGMQERGIYGANVGDWDDEIAARTWAAALAKDVDRTIVQKGVTDTPLWMKSNWGRLIMQFKSFGLASHQRVLIAGLQERPHRLAEQLVLSTAIGMMVAWLKIMEKEVTTGKFEESERLMENPGLWIADGLDRTGILSLPFEISNTAEKVGSPFGIVPMAQALANDPDRGGTASRYASRNKLGAVMGPSAGIFEDLTTIASQLSAGDLRPGGATALINQIPGGSLPIVKSVLQGKVKPFVREAVE